MTSTSPLKFTSRYINFNQDYLTGTFSIDNNFNMCDFRVSSKGIPSNFDKSRKIHKSRIIGKSANGIYLIELEN